MVDVDLDELARAYRFRPASVDSLARAERAGRRLEPGTRVLDVGGGPGNHAAVWSGNGLRPVVLDPSAVMLAAVHDRGLVGVRGRAQGLPFRSQRFALVWFHLSIHYGDWKVAIDEAVRVIDRSGTVEIWTLGSDHHEQSWLAQWFPSVPSIESQRFPDPAVLAEFLGTRVRSVELSHSIESVVRPVGEWQRAIEAGFISTLQLIPEDERLAGMAAIRDAHLAAGGSVSYQLRFTRIVGR